MRSWLVITCGAGLLQPSWAGQVSVEPVPNDAGTVAWVRFVHGSESFQGTPYLWLGRCTLHINFAVRPQPGQALELLWGAKADQRQAVVEVNGQAFPVQAGGWEGFRWVRLPLPTNLPGSQIAVRLSAGPSSAPARPAFLAEVRLTAPGGDPGRPDLKQPTYKAHWTEQPLPGAEAAEAFPEMRKIWDRSPPPPPPALAKDPTETLFRQAERNARLANEAFYRCRRYVDGWLAHADPVTGLIPRNLTDSRDYWNGRDAAADNYPFMVLTAALIDRPLLEGRLLQMLQTEQRLTSRLGRLPDDYSFSKRGWRRDQLDVQAVIFDGAEYVKDGLIPITEWLGPSPWSERMLGIMDDIWQQAYVPTPFGPLPTLNLEVNGDLLQACARLYWFTGQRKYLDWGTRLADFYLLGTNHPTRHFSQVRLVDHGCEVLNGLTEVYVAVAHAAPEKKRAYEQPLRELFDCVLARGRNADGLLYVWFNPTTGQHSDGLCDTWGYDYDGVYTLWLVDGLGDYRDAVRHVLANLQGKYTGACWADRSADGFADAIEGTLTLFNREPVASAAEWIDAQIRLMWAKQQPSGIFEGWHGDGNVARTSLMYALWKTQGLIVQPWRPDVRFGAVRQADTLYVSLRANQPWQGRLLFDKPRHKVHLRLPLDYPRINQFPEWFTVQPQDRCRIRDLTQGTEHRLSGQQLWDGLEVSVQPDVELRLMVARQSGD